MAGNSKYLMRIFMLSNNYLFYLYAVIIIASCKANPPNNSENRSLIEPTTNCPKFVHPQLIDDVTVFDSLDKNHNSFVLKSYFINNCVDTIALAMFQSRLYTGLVEWYLSNGNSMSDIIDDKYDHFQILRPNDSIYMPIIDLDSRFVKQLDSIKILIVYKLKNEERQEFLKIDGYDISK